MFCVLAAHTAKLSQHVSTSTCACLFLLALLGFAQSDQDETCRGVPEISVPNCNDGWGVVAKYYLTDAPGFSPPIEQTSTQLCWNGSGIIIFSNNSDSDIWQQCENCGCANFAHGDVAEVFLAPVSSLDNAPSWYYELDVGAISGAFWGSLIHNTLGNDSLYSSTFDCSADPSPGGFQGCDLNCSGLLPAVHVARGPTWWSRKMLLPWGLFLKKFGPGDQGGTPWRDWRANFYRYSYPFKFSNGTFNRERPQLSGWSPTHSGSFHVPDSFGKLTFLAPGDALVL